LIISGFRSAPGLGYCFQIKSYAVPFLGRNHLHTIIKLESKHEMPKNCLKRGKKGEKQLLHQETIGFFHPVRQQLYSQLCFQHAGNHLGKNWLGL